jgi:hypothetical protein
MDMAEPDRMFFACLIESILIKNMPLKRIRPAPDPKPLFMVPFPIQKYQLRGISGLDADRSTIFQV